MAKKLPARSRSRGVAQQGTVAREVSVDADLLTNLRGQIAAINRSQAVIEFDPSGHVLTANDHFLKVIGYRLEEIKGQHHSMFVDAAYRASDAYRQFWEKLCRGEFDSGQYRRLAKGGSEVWIRKRTAVAKQGAAVTPAPAAKAVATSGAADWVEF